MNLTTTYLGLELKNPIVCGACPLGTNIDTIRHLEMAGAAAVVLPSLFEEEIVGEAQAQMAMESIGAGFGEASSYLPDPEGYHVGPERYLDHVKAAKDAASIPIIGSLNGSTPGGWIRYAEKIEKAGADAIELNAYYLATDPEATGAAIEEQVLAVVRAVREAVSIPIAIKLSPFYSSLSNFARELEKAGANGLVLFNRFYQPDLDIEELDVIPNLRLSTADELRLRLRWLSILSSQLGISLSCTGGAHNAVDVIKAVMTGAHSVQMVSALLIHGPEHIQRTIEAIEFWLNEHDYESLKQMQGSMNMSKVPVPAKLTRANYMEMLDSWQQ
jgi:dihydroorotate dehydrogenase (fumarate)